MIHLGGSGAILAVLMPRFKTMWYLLIRTQIGFFWGTKKPCFFLGGMFGKGMVKVMGGRIFNCFFFRKIKNPG